MTKTWMTSDQHYGHANIIRFCARPFADLEEMHRELIARHNAVVSDGDDVWHLGDFSLDDRLVRQILPQLRGTHRLVAGNHDRCHPCHRKSEAAKRKYMLHGFAAVHTQIHLGRFLLCHLPYVGDSGHEARYPEWRPKNEGRWLLCGHVHESWQIREKQINVGVDVWEYRPVALDVLERIAAELRPLVRDIG